MDILKEINQLNKLYNIAERCEELLLDMKLAFLSSETINDCEKEFDDISEALDYILYSVDKKCRSLGVKIIKNELE